MTSAMRTASRECQRSRRSPSQVRTRRRHPSLTAPAIPVRRSRVRVRGCPVMIREGRSRPLLPRHTRDSAILDRPTQSAGRSPELSPRRGIPPRRRREQGGDRLALGRERLERGPGYDPGASSRLVTWQVGEFCELPRLRLLGVRRAVFDRGRRDCLFERCHAIAAGHGIRECCEVCAECQTGAGSLLLEAITRLIADLDRRGHTFSMTTDRAAVASRLYCRSSCA